MSKITTIIFDVYETLAVNNEDMWIDTFHRICHAQGLPLDGEELFRQWKALEVVFRRERLDLESPEKSPPFKSYEEAWRECFQKVFSRLGLAGDPAAAARKAVTDMGLREPYPEVLEALAEVQARWRVGVLSNADEDYLRPTLERIGFSFEAVLSSEIARAYKPLPAPFYRITDMMGVSPEECVYVGDNQFDDVLGASRVGMSTAWVNRNGASLNPQLPAPDFIVKRLTELPQVLDGKD